MSTRESNGHTYYTEVIDLAKVQIDSTNTWYGPDLRNVTKDGTYLPYWMIDVAHLGLTGGDASNLYKLEAYLGREPNQDKAALTGINTKTHVMRPAYGLMVPVNSYTLASGAGPLSGRSGELLPAQNSTINDIHKFRPMFMAPYPYFIITNAALTANRHNAGTITFHIQCWRV